MTLLLLLSWFMILTVVLPFVKNDYWIFRICEYPRFQKLILCSILLIVWIVLGDYGQLFQHITFVLLLLSVAYLLFLVWPYLPMAKQEVKTVATSDTDNQLSIYTCNVFQDNKDFARLINQVKQIKPDLIFLLETDTEWETAMDEAFGHDYPNQLKQPLPNTYGLLLYSRLPFKEAKIHFLVEKDVPSAQVQLLLPSGHPVTIWGLHPKPPVPGEDDRSTAKDKELMKVALKVKDANHSTIVMGDLNDVAWSYVTDLFRKTSGLLDPRRGRGFYSTFSANYWFMRFPLDYIFSSADFGLVQMKRMPHVGSDHFPMFVQLQFNPSLEHIHEKPVATPEEKAEAKEKATNAID
ncbi:endonuclease/exonuclease/phosphatase family protein [Flavihumibacter cheonanensis]|uniref:endonuclease/exonuclease/phosphatase family protein n=1 Tax=Flavihumibacter cheonanensis TaxID=1442385 RepID=UPI001EF7E8D9|nr:endonuclease/exonuclease/phosphatase family protein [Flavihumibacter cheonanensis]MCG7754288.1 endonuclease/exonuclease/phosphatase family protein [Flavihumibacter cheonanensis]